MTDDITALIEQGNKLVERRRLGSGNLSEGHGFLQINGDFSK
jgi:hypothetical protein